MYKGYLDKCMPSELMRGYLKNIELEAWRVVDIIMYSPVSINIKHEELIRVKENAETRNDSNLIDECEVGIKNIELAKSYLDADGVFSVEIFEFDDEKKDNDGYFECICGSYDDVKECIKADLESYEAKPEDLRWYSISKWIKNSEGKYIEACSYLIARDEIIYFMIGRNIDTGEFDTFDYYWSENLNLPVPYTPGDILECDGFPFGPKFRMLIVDIGDNHDCCCVQGLALNEEGLWECGAVKHGMVSYSYSPKISYLYTAEIYQGQLTERETVLKNLSDYIGGDEKRGQEIYDKVCCKALNDEELIERM